MVSSKRTKNKFYSFSMDIKFIGMTHSCQQKTAKGELKSGLILQHFPHLKSLIVALWLVYQFDKTSDML